MPPELSIVLPAFNEEASVASAIERAATAVAGLVEDFEVVVVDDGSADATAETALAVAREHPGVVRVVRHERNQGYGAAIRSGFRHSRGRAVFYTDADNQFDVAELKWFLPLMADHDLVIGFRVYRYDTVLRSVVSWCYNRLVGVLFRVRVRDVDCAYKLIRREVLDKITIESDDFFVDTELVAKARKWNFRIAEKGVRHYPRLAGETTVTASDIPRTLRTIWHMWRRIYTPTQADRRLMEAVRERDTAVELTA